MRNLGPALLLVLILATNSFAAPAVVKSAVFPEPGLLALLGGGLVGLATLVRRHLSDQSSFLLILPRAPSASLFLFPNRCHCPWAFSSLPVDDFIQKILMNPRVVA